LIKTSIATRTSLGLTSTCNITLSSRPALFGSVNELRASQWETLALLESGTEFHLRLTGEKFADERIRGRCELGFKARVNSELLRERVAHDGNIEDDVV